MWRAQMRSDSSVTAILQMSFVPTRARPKQRFEADNNYQETQVRQLRETKAIWLNGVLAAIFVPLASCGGSASDAPAASLDVQTDAGVVRGVKQDSVEKFLGIPYAAPPVGALRWMPPQPVAPWNGARDASALGHVCPQQASGTTARQVSEDCLVVNVQRPVGARGGDKLPVYFYIHGGGLINGSGNNEDMEKFVARTGAIAVTVNYRLGALGFLTHSALADARGDSGNYGLMDQQAAMQWVQRNIAVFGGDPARVTMGGESAGGVAVCAQLAAPGAKGLFMQAIDQSGACISHAKTEASAAGADYAVRLGCADPATAAACLRAKSVDALLDAQTEGDETPTRDTALLPQDPLVAVKAGVFNKVPMILGSNMDEGRSFTSGFIGKTQQDYQTWLTAHFGALSGAILARYPWPSPDDRYSAAYAVAAVTTDSGLVAGAIAGSGAIDGGIGGCSTRQTARYFSQYVPVHAYQWSYRDGPGSSIVPGFVNGAGHAAELAYQFPKRNGGVVSNTFTPGQVSLSDRLIDSWGAFVKDGTTSFATAPAWPAYQPGGTMLSIDVDNRSALQHQCDFWDSLIGQGVRF
jgi:carboxylesterase type B